MLPGAAVAVVVDHVPRHKFCLRIEGAGIGEGCRAAHKHTCRAGAVAFAIGGFGGHHVVVFANTLHRIVDIHVAFHVVGYEHAFGHPRDFVAERCGVDVAAVRAHSGLLPRQFGAAFCSVGDAELSNFSRHIVAYPHIGGCQHSFA